jgi:hypothetical protein
LSCGGWNVGVEDFGLASSSDGLELSMSCAHRCSSCEPLV